MSQTVCGVLQKINIPTQHKIIANLIIVSTSLCKHGSASLLVCVFLHLFVRYELTCWKDGAFCSIYVAVKEVTNYEVC